MRIHLYILLTPLVYNSMAIAQSCDHPLFVDPVFIDLDFDAGSSRIAMGDVDNDNDLDLVMAAGGGTSSVVLLNEGSGTFVELGIPHVPVGGTQNITLEDLNQDGNLDLIFTDAGGPDTSLALMMGNGNGTFGLPMYKQVRDLARKHHVADLDGDGDLDIAVATYFSLSLFYNTGGGVFLDEQRLPTIDKQTDVTVADLNGDGRSDIAVAFFDAGNRALGVYFADNENGFNEVESFQTNIGNANHIVSSDFDQDGDIDLALASVGNNAFLNLKRNDGSGGFSSNQSVSVTSGITDFEMADVNQDDLPDLLVAAYTSTAPGVHVALNNGMGSFGQFFVYFNQSVSAFAVGDLDGDSDQDLALVSGGFGIALSQCAPPPPCPADLDGDGDLDFFDISGFLAFYQLGDLAVDFTGDGVLDFFDVSAFLNAFNAGCP